jgi:hypothetical protein
MNPYHYHRGRTFYLQFMRYTRNLHKVWMCPVCKRKETTY